MAVYTAMVGLEESQEEGSTGEEVMERCTQMLGIWVLAAALLMGGGAQYAHAKSPLHMEKVDYRVLLMDTLLGTAVGGAAGLTFGVMGDAESEDILSDYIAPGLGIGALGGLLYALLYDTPLFTKNLYLPNGHPKGILHIDVADRAVNVHPLRALPKQEFRQEEGLAWRVNMVTMSF